MQMILVALSCLLVLVLTIAGGRSGRELGIRGNGFVASLWSWPVAGLGMAMVLIMGLLAGTLHPLDPGTPRWHALIYLAWALEQQFLLQSFFFVRLERVTRQPALAAALLFSSVHIPNLALVLATAFAGWFFCECFRRWRNLYPLAVAHAGLGLALASAVPDSWLHHMRVGISYLKYFH